MQPDRSPAVFCLRSGDQPGDWWLDQVHALGATDWSAAGETDDATWVAQAARAIAEETGGEPAHLLASGPTVPRALLLAVHHPDLVASVLAGDPAVDEDDPAYWELLRQVAAPTLVLVAAPRRDADTAQAQTVAGGIENGVLVIVDDAQAPVHRRAAHSFNEWVTAFMSIAEGLQTLVHHREDTHA